MEGWIRQVCCKVATDRPSLTSHAHLDRRLCAGGAVIVPGEPAGYKRRLSRSNLHPIATRVRSIVARREPVARKIKLTVRNEKLVTQRGTNPPFHAASSPINRKG